MLADTEGETDVTVKIETPFGETHLTHGFFKDVGSPVTAFTLDPDPEFEMEYDRPELALTVLGYQGQVKKLTAWVATPDGPQVVLTHSFPEPVALMRDETLRVVGPAY